MRVEDFKGACDCGKKHGCIVIEKGESPGVGGIIRLATEHNGSCYDPEEEAGDDYYFVRAEPSDVQKVLDHDGLKVLIWERMGFD